MSPSLPSSESSPPPGDDDGKHQPEKNHHKKKTTIRQAEEEETELETLRPPAVPSHDNHQSGEKNHKKTAIRQEEEETEETLRPPTVPTTHNHHQGDPEKNIKKTTATTATSTAKRGNGKGTSDNPAAVAESSYAGNNKDLKAAQCGALREWEANGTHPQGDTSTTATIAGNSSSAGGGTSVAGAYAIAGPGFPSYEDEGQEGQQLSGSSGGEEDGTNASSNAFSTADHNDGLVEARPVPEEEGEIREVAKPAEEEADLEMQQGGLGGDGSNHSARRPKTRSKSRHTLFCLVLAVVAVLAVLLAVVVPLSLNNNSEKEPSESSSSTIGNDTTTASAQNNDPNIDYLVTILPQESMEIALQQQQDDTDADPTNNPSPQSLALHWLADDPNLKEYPVYRLHQRYALATFFYSTGGPFWFKNDYWLSYEVHECDWYAYDMFFTYGKAFGPSKSSCDEETNSRYTKLWQSTNNLTGTLPRELWTMLPSLESIYIFNHTQLHGPLQMDTPQIESTLSNLTMISVNRNPLLSGTIPTQLGLLTKLSILFMSGINLAFWLSGNHVQSSNWEGTIPTELGKLTNMQEMVLRMNYNLTGPIPSQLGNLHENLNLLMLRESSYTGTIPSELGRLTNLKYLFLSDNKLHGNIPTQLGSGLFSSLTYLHLPSNQLTGSIPSQLGLLSPETLGELVLANNTLTGPVPSQLGLLRKLRMIFLSNNTGLTGNIPLTFENLTDVEAFDISSTSIVTDSIPEHLIPVQDNTTFVEFVQCGNKFPC